MRFWFIGDALEWVLRTIYSGIPNYAIAMLIFTVGIRLLLTPLDLRSKRSMMRMAKVQPQSDALKKKYEKEPEKLNAKMTELYKREKVSPLAGCLPMLITLPILFAMFAVMHDLANEETVQIVLDIKNHITESDLSYRPAFQTFLWIKNVFQPDTVFATVIPAAGNNVLQGYSATSHITKAMIDEAQAFLATDLYASYAAAYGNTAVYTGSVLGLFTLTIPKIFNGLCILPLIAGLSQYLATKVQGTATAQNDANPGMGKFMKYFFPLLSVWFCFTSNAAFALYWASSALLQILTQYGGAKWIEYSDAKKALKEAQQA